MLRKVGAVIAGFIVASAVMMVFEFTNSKIFTFPANLDRSDLNAVREFARTLPQTAFLLVLGGWAVGSFLAGWVVRKIARESGLTLPVILSALLLLGGILNFMFLPHPLWVMALGVLIFLTLPLAGFKIGRR
jgi:hypothetical protein